MRRSTNIQRIAALLFVLASLQACASGTQLISEPADASAVTGVYTLYLYGCRYPDDLENVAFLVSERSKYPFEIYALDSRYKVKKGLPAREALAQADKFVKCSFHDTSGTQLRRIPDGSGGAIGFELKPLYLPYQVGEADVLLIGYSLKNGAVRTTIRLDPDVEKNQDASGDRGDRSGK